MGYNEQLTVNILNYATAPRRRWRWLAILLMLAASAFAARHWLANTWRQLHYSFRWERCLRAALPPEKVVYDEQPERAKRLLHQPDFHTQTRILFDKGWYPTPPRSWHAPACYDAPVLFAEAFKASTHTGVIFVQGRTSPRGVNRLVIGRCGATAFGPGGHVVYVIARAYAKGTPQSGAVYGVGSDLATLSIRLLSGDEYLRLYAGQADPADKSHFTIRYDINGAEGIIDGWLRDGPPPDVARQVSPVMEWVELRFRSGPGLQAQRRGPWSWGK